MMTEIPDKVYSVLNYRFKILDHLSFLEFDHDFDKLKSRLESCRRDQFHHTDRIIIEHMDTDYYFDQCAVGINLRNFFVVVEELDIPRYVFIFYTNHFGLQKEIESFCQHCDASDRPLVIESFLSKWHSNLDLMKKIDGDISSITHHALCMMNLTRSHRNAVFHSLKSISTDVLALNVTMTNRNKHANR